MVVEKVVIFTWSMSLIWISSIYISHLVSGSWFHGLIVVQCVNCMKSLFGIEIDTLTKLEDLEWKQALVKETLNWCFIRCCGVLGVKQWPYKGYMIYNVYYTIEVIVRYWNRYLNKARRSRVKTSPSQRDSKLTFHKMLRCLGSETMTL